MPDEEVKLVRRDYFHRSRNLSWSIKRSLSSEDTESSREELIHAGLVDIAEVEVNQPVQRHEKKHKISGFCVEIGQS